MPMAGRWDKLHDCLQTVVFRVLYEKRTIGPGLADGSGTSGIVLREAPCCGRTHFFGIISGWPECFQALFAVLIWRRGLTSGLPVFFALRS